MSESSTPFVGLDVHKGRINFELACLSWEGERGMRGIAERGIC
jgi:hypothetical protein